MGDNLMIRAILRPDIEHASARLGATVLALIVCNLAFNIVANTGFKLSADSQTWRTFLAWQVIGNLAGFITVITLTGLLRFVPLSVGFPVTTGLAVIGVQVVAARLIFHEAISPARWLGSLFVILGIVMICRK
jgi:multidrug transporter EmrE-like cation transporter